ncbi:transcriptional regulator NanR [Sulfitobacter pseudonitzschiae]|uniref:Transcriptional regulator NanR n=1 Tax=Pseudosulfitobacter pseudonitzschiae TaxID=1402135 RepID=A0A9Q2NSC9_9RHOB|nr:transcriptional regulator NanR [Pseudosulfitobacter pseudonitzschiae]MBM2293514.1 transcriptional regulator NanR [Pseudosulfitobacter pseudonitzschiae]MBM2298328.1 transcriptional regulator NanR [Pseudosulfitobacter pseudonitzschiae]MBM2303242.1 transcriptional regulator NanR [Pseudosulfitobacter pseudonitzschiae]MBM2313025.1 transcriptional regulator NanR [Pseudosulfitobacter pseudonitzschiae]MBM2317938.1 transcriptional regulator NanR [Pseudosulfitobacter pseudonitzschiae]
MSTPTDPIPRRKLSDEVFDRLHAMIIGGEVAPGDPMPSERALMDRFGVGRPVVREALQTLNTMGLITVSHGERSRVNAITPKSALAQLDGMAQTLLSIAPENLGHLKDARRMFELGLVRVAALQRTDADLTALHHLIAMQSAAHDVPEDFVAADIAFHARIIAIAGNPVITALADAMLKWIFHNHGTLLRWSGHEDTTLSEHRQIVAAIAARDADAAVALMATHLDRSAGLQPRD